MLQAIFNNMPANGNALLLNVRNIGVESCCDGQLVKLYKGHATRPAIGMHHKVDPIRAHPISSKKPAAAQNVNQCVAVRESAVFCSAS